MKIRVNLADCIMEHIGSESSEVLDGLESFLRLFEYKVPVNYDYSPQTRHYPGHEEITINTRSSIRPTGSNPMDNVPDIVRSIITGAVEGRPQTEAVWDAVEHVKEAV